MANQNVYFDKPETTIIEAFPSDNTISSNERGDQDSSQEPSGKCSNSENYLKNPTSVNNHMLLPEFVSSNHLNTPKADPYLRATFRNGYYYPYSDYTYYSDSPRDLPRRGFSNDYNDGWYPYTNPDVFAPYSIIPPVKSLPPVYARFYGNSLPVEEAWIPKVRRQIGLDDEDFIKQLEYESMMKNILPTMPIPLARDAPLQTIGVPYTYASFPHGMSDCAIPFLLGCRPTISYGSLSSSMPVPYVHAYRNLGSDQVHDHLDMNDKSVKEINDKVVHK